MTSLDLDKYSITGHEYINKWKYISIDFNKNKLGNLK